MVTCTFNMPTSDGATYNQLYRSVQETEDKSVSTVSVPSGTVVPKHFKPLNDQAEKDRADQIENPEKYISTKENLILLGEILVKEGMFTSLHEAKEAIRERAKEIGLNSELLGDASVAETRRIAAIEELLSRADDDKTRRKLFGKILKDGGITFFGGAPARNLAQMVYDNDLYVAPKS